MSLYAACSECGWQELVADQPSVADLDEAGRRSVEHNLAEHFGLITVREVGSRDE
ncbi:hypothetical protein [Microbacterium soli]|uniref:Uncharacterized protein n=1 Tax=Microbacterium soli TaxID=446075 RepID=A0ABP7NLB9_9MICO